MVNATKADAKKFRRTYREYIKRPIRVRVDSKETRIEMIAKILYFFKSLF